MARTLLALSCDAGALLERDWLLLCLRDVANRRPLSHVSTVSFNLQAEPGGRPFLALAQTNKQCSMGKPVKNKERKLSPRANAGESFFFSEEAVARACRVNRVLRPPFVVKFFLVLVPVSCEFRKILLRRRPSV